MLCCAQHDKAGSFYRALARLESYPGLLIVAELPKLYYHTHMHKGILVYEMPVKEVAYL